MELLTMTSSELRRIQILQRVQDGYLSQVAAAEALCLTERQVRRLVKALARGGPEALISQRRGRPPNNRITDACAEQILDYYRTSCTGFGPTLFAQTLAERQSIHVSREWIRRLLCVHGLWKPNARKRSVHSPRERRAHFGELVQMDGSPHDWFEGRADKCTLLLAVDDATSRVCAARLEPAETTDGYFRLLRTHLETFGRFGAAYTDKHSIFRYNGQSDRLDIETQLQRALRELDIQLICANSPQAKGRVERANRTFQDRLPKAMRLAGINALEAANAFLPAFVRDYNVQYAKVPAESADSHRGISGFDLDEILCHREERVVSKNLTFQLGEAIYALVDPYSRSRLPVGARIQVRRTPAGEIRAHHGHHALTAEYRASLQRYAPVVGSKNLNAHLDRRASNPKKAHTPAANHPWRTPGRLPQPDISALQKPDITALR